MGSGSVQSPNDQIPNDKLNANNCVIKLTIRLTTGKSIVQVAVLEATSVNIREIKQTTTVMKNGDRLSKTVSCDPIQLERPDCSVPSAIAKPPPRSRMMPQATDSWVVFQSRSGGEVLSSVGRAGIKKKNMTTNIAGTESLIKLLIDQVRF